MIGVNAMPEIDLEALWIAIVNQHRKGRPVFQLVRLALNDRHQVVGRVPLQPFFELRDDAMAMAEFGAARSNGEYRYDQDRDCWWATDPSGRTFRFVVELVDVEAHIAA
jgi:hypothetical protein